MKMALFIIHLVFLTWIYDIDNFTYLLLWTDEDGRKRTKVSRRKWTKVSKDVPKWVEVARKSSKRAQIDKTWVRTSNTWYKKISKFPTSWRLYYFFALKTTFCNFLKKNGNRLPIGCVMATNDLSSFSMTFWPKSRSTPHTYTHVVRIYSSNNPPFAWPHLSITLHS